MNLRTRQSLETLKKNLPNQSVIIQLFDENQKHLAFIGCRHQQKIPLYNSENDRELSRFYDVISNLESEVLCEYFKTEKDLKDNTVWATAIFITGEHAEIIYQTKPLPG